MWIEFVVGERLISLVKDGREWICLGLLCCIYLNFQVTVPVSPIQLVFITLQALSFQLSGLLVEGWMVRIDSAMKACLVFIKSARNSSAHVKIRFM